jgi:hypothetical protein
MMKKILYKVGLLLAGTLIAAAILLKFMEYSGFRLLSIY